MFQLDAQLDVELASDILGPGQLDALVGVVANVGDVPAGVEVHHHAFTGGQMPDDWVARNRCAALGVVEHQPFRAADCQRPFERRRLFVIARYQAARDHVGHAIAQPDVFQQILDVFHVVLGEHLLNTLRADLLQTGFETTECLAQQALAEVDRLRAALQLERMADMRTGFAGDDEIKPCRVWPRARCGDDLHRRATFQRLRQRRQATVDAAGYAGVADIGMHRIGEVDGGRTLGHLHDAALGGEDVDLVGEQVDLHALDEFQRVAGTLLQLQHTLDPLSGAGMGSLGHFVLGRLVQPVRSDAVVGHLFHLAGANLDLDGHAMHAEQGGVQGLVAIGLGDRDVILEASR